MGSVIINSSMVNNVKICQFFYYSVLNYFFEIFYFFFLILEISNFGVFWVFWVSIFRICCNSKNLLFFFLLFWRFFGRLVFQFFLFKFFRFFFFKFFQLLIFFFKFLFFFKFFFKTFFQNLVSKLFFKTFFKTFFKIFFSKFYFSKLFLNLFLNFKKKKCFLYVLLNVVVTILNYFKLNHLNWEIKNGEKKEIEMMTWLELMVPGVS